MKPILGALALHATAATARNFINWDATDHDIVPNWIWHTPFPSDGTDPMGFDPTCDVEKTIQAHQYTVGDLLEPSSGWQDAMTQLMQRKYPGNWDGTDAHGNNRWVMMIEYEDVPKYVRDWYHEHDDAGKADRLYMGVFVKPDFRKQKHAEGTYVPATATPLVKAQATQAAEKSQAEEGKKAEESKVEEGEKTEEEKKKEAEAEEKRVAEARKQQHEEEDRLEHIPDRHKVFIFAAGAIYEQLPLWVAKGSKCEGQLSDLKQYVKHAQDNKVIAFPVEHTKPEGNKRDMHFIIRAMVVEEHEHAKEWRTTWEQLNRQNRRLQRKWMKEDRAAGKGEFAEPDSPRHDEL